MSPGRDGSRPEQELGLDEDDGETLDLFPEDRPERFLRFGPHEARRRGRTVQWTQVSASQIQAYLKCKRLWFNQSVLRIPQVQGGSRALGEAMHLILEMIPQNQPYSIKDVPNCSPEDWAIAEGLAKQIIPLLPKIDLFEPGIEMDTYVGGPRFKGYIDTVTKPGRGWFAYLIPKEDGAGIINDYKSTSAWRYMKTPEELADDVQMMSYAKWGISAPGMVAWDETPPDDIWLVHTYANTKNKISPASIRHSEIKVNRDRIDSKWDAILSTIREMQNTACASAALDVEGSGALTGHCQAYGGCQFRAECGHSPVSAPTALKNLFKQTSETPAMSNALMDRIKAARSGAPAPTPTAPATTPPAPATPAPVAAATPAPVAAPAKSGLSALLANKPVTNTGIVPADAPPRDQPVITQPGQAVAQEIPSSESDGDEGDDGDEGEPVTGTLNMATTGPAAPIVVSSAPRRGRPTKEESAAKKAAEEAALNAEIERRVNERLAQGGGDPGAFAKLKAEYDSLAATTTAIRDARDEAFSKINEIAKDRDYFKNLADAAATAAATTQTPSAGLSEAELAEIEATIAQLTTERDAALARANVAYATAPEASSDSKGTTLYLNCYPQKGAPEGSVTDFAVWIQPVLDVIAQDNGVPDWRLIEYKSKAFLAVALRGLIQAEGMPAKIQIDTAHSAAPVALEILAPLARKIVRAH